MRAVQARRGVAPAAGTGGSGKAEAAAPAAMKSRGTTPLERINEDAAVVDPTS